MENPQPENNRQQEGRCRAETNVWLAAIYDTCATGLYRYALMILADHSAAEDAVHQTFVKLVASGKGISEITSFNGYLRNAVRNESYRILRKRINNDKTALESAAILEAADQEVSNEEERQVLEEAIHSLPAEQREIIYMKVYEQMSFKQIASDLDISINTAASRYRYAIDKLRHHLASYCRMEGYEND